LPGLFACRIYELYSDYVLKNPFYEVEQVIKCELFDEHVDMLMRKYPSMLQGV
jgi:trafficking protein particle complex subunit 4